MATGSKAGLYQNAQSASYLPPTLAELAFLVLLRDPPWQYSHYTGPERREIQNQKWK